MALQTALLPGQSAVRLLTALWHVAKSDLSNLAASASSPSPVTFEPVTHPSPSGRHTAHTPSSHFHAPLRCLQLAACSLTPVPSVAAAAPRACLAKPQPEWPSSCLNAFHYSTAAPWQAGIASKRPPQPAGTEDVSSASASSIPAGNSGSGTASKDGSSSPATGGASGLPRSSSGAGVDSKTGSRKAGGRAGESPGGAAAAATGAQRGKVEPVKEMHLKPRIAEHDLAYKLRQMEGWLADGIRSKLVVEFRGAERSEAAAALVDSVVLRLAGKGQPLAARQQNKDAWIVTLRPLTPKQQQQLKPQLPQSQQSQPSQQPQSQLSQQQQQQQQQEQQQSRKGVDGAAREGPSAAA